MKENKDERQERVDKLQNYDKYVKDMHWPRTSKKRQI